jgi:hypothetical protein
MFYIIVLELELCIDCYGGSILSYPLSNTLLSMLHDKICDLLDNRIIPILHVPISRKRKCRQSKLDARYLWGCRRRGEIHETHVESILPNL